MRVLGLMSGTSADGVDAVLVELSGSAEHPHWTLLRSASLDYPASTRQLILAVGQGEAKTASTLLNLSETITKIQAAAARQCDPEGQAQLVGCHGQTLWHRPPKDAETGALQPGASWQMLQAPLLAQLLKRPVIFDFRAADLALGGQGAPLVPKADAALLGRTKGWRALLNLGGIANLTLIPPDAGPDRLQPVRGWDCGPANSLIDLAMEQFSEGKESCDESGRLAETGQCDEALILRWLAEPYFQLSPPKSTGRELFGRADLTRRLQEMQGQADCRSNRNAHSLLSRCRSAGSATALQPKPSAPHRALGRWRWQSEPHVDARTHQTLPRPKTASQRRAKTSQSKPRSHGVCSFGVVASLGISRECTSDYGCRARGRPRSTRQSGLISD